MYSLSLDLTRPRDLRIIWLYGWKSPTPSHQAAKFGVHRDYDSEDNKVFDFSRDLRTSCDCRII